MLSVYTAELCPICGKNIRSASCLLYICFNMQEYLKKITNKIGDHKLKLLLFLSWVGFFIIYFIPFFSEGIGYFLRLFFILLPALIISTGRTDLFFRSFRSWLPWGVIAIQVFCLGYNVYAEYYSLNLTYYDTGWFWNTIANFMNGKGFYSSQLGLSELADHFCPGLLTLLPFAYMFPNPVLLIITRLVFLSFQFTLSVVL
jgi:hypothetical protein